MNTRPLFGLGDVLLDKRVTPDQVQAALSTLLSLPLEQVVVSLEIESIRRSPDPKVFCHIQFLERGEFHTHLTPYEALSKNLPTVPLLVSLCQFLQCRCLTGDEDVNPFTYYLIDGSGSCQRVGINPHREDEGEYVLSTGTIGKNL